MENHYSINIINDYFDNALSVEVSKKITDHLKRCEKCRSYYTSLVLTSVYLNNEKKLDYEFQYKVLNKVDNSLYPLKPFPLRLIKVLKVLKFIVKPIAVAAAVFLCILLIGYGKTLIYNNSGKSYDNAQTTSQSPTWNKIDTANPIREKNVISVIDRPMIKMVKTQVNDEEKELLFNLINSDIMSFSTYIPDAFTFEQSITDSMNTLIISSKTTKTEDKVVIVFLSLPEGTYDLQLDTTILSKITKILRIITKFDSLDILERTPVQMKNEFSFSIKEDDLSMNDNNSKAYGKISIFKHNDQGYLVFVQCPKSLKSEIINTVELIYKEIIWAD